ncbi:MAG TPA: AAA family ATPase [Candidatus Saccharimonadales bacterium]|nr:AAA family ATPase [Candidatus Saccharimonadales bacterium]
MIISKVELKNWRNFEHAEVELDERMFLVGPNASGKSNLLDVFKFLHDLAQPGGLQRAISNRGGVPQMRCLSARKESDIGITVELGEPGSRTFAWRYSIGIKLQVRGEREPYLTHETVWRNGETEPFKRRPDTIDNKDPKRLTQTYLEQISANAEFREMALFFQEINYLHLIPQVVKYPEEFRGKKLAGDPYGHSFLERVAATTARTRDARLRKIDRALNLVVPQLCELNYRPDDTFGVPHLEARFKHWRPSAGKQRENQFSDGTLRLIGLLWSLMESDSLLLLEEPELSLHTGIVKQLAPLIRRLQRTKSGKRQVIVSTHSEALLSNHQIDPREVLMLVPGKDGTTTIVSASSDQEIRELLAGGMNIAEAVIPRTVAKEANQMLLGFE